MPRVRAQGVLLSTWAWCHSQGWGCGARGRAGGLAGFSDPYVTVTVGRKTQKTKIVKQTLNPRWNEKMLLCVPPDPHREVDRERQTHGHAGRMYLLAQHARGRRGADEAPSAPVPDRGGHCGLWGCGHGTSSKAYDATDEILFNVFDWDFLSKGARRTAYSHSRCLWRARALRSPCIFADLHVSVCCMCVCVSVCVCVSRRFSGDGLGACCGPDAQLVRNLFAAAGGARGRRPSARRHLCGCVASPPLSMHAHTRMVYTGADG
jgi:hypothetical protein